MQNINSRLELIMNKELMNYNSFAKLLNVNAVVVRNIIIGRNKPSFDFIIKLIETFDYINTEWLLTGKGEMLKSEKPKIESKIKNSWVGNTVVGEGNHMILEDSGVGYGNENIKMLKQEIEYLKEQNQLLKSMIELLKTK